MNILSLDLATKTGWAVLTGSEVVESGTQTFDLRRGESAGMRFLRFRAWLKKMIEESKPEVIYYEKAHHRGGHATELCVGMTTRVMEMACENEIEYRAVHTGTLKKQATGNGRASKQEMIAHAKTRWPGQVVEDDNQADALLLLAYAIEELRGCGT
jgi:Holliday junction resolvasome RuvABC endonuclease subunit